MCNCAAGYTGQVCQTGKIQSSWCFLARPETDTNTNTPCPPPPPHLGSTILNRFSSTVWTFQHYLDHVAVLWIPFPVCFVIDINECVSNPCENGGACNDELNAYTCTCIAGYTGPECQQGEIISECLDMPTGTFTHDLSQRLHACTGNRSTLKGHSGFIFDAEFSMPRRR